MVALKIVGIIVAAVVAFLTIVGCAAIAAALMLYTLKDEGERVPDDVIERTRKHETERIHSGD